MVAGLLTEWERDESDLEIASTRSGDEGESGSKVLPHVSMPGRSYWQPPVQYARHILQNTPSVTGCIRALNELLANIEQPSIAANQGFCGPWKTYPFSLHS